jgi:hypothetical protein
MRVSPTSRAFVFAIAIGAAAVLVVGFVDLRMRPSLDTGMDSHLSDRRVPANAQV